MSFSANIRHAEQEADEATVFTETPELSADTIVYLVDEKRVCKHQNHIALKRLVWKTLGPVPNGCHVSATALFR